MFPKIHLNKLRTSLLLGAMVASAGLAIQPALAQQAGNGEGLETVVVTGTLIGRNDLQTASPIQVISAGDIQAQGFTSVADVVRSISADNSGSLSDAFNGAFAVGAAAVSLRGLTSDNTLILINGHRTSNYPLADDGERTFTDLNTLPMDAIDQVQVLKDGASSVYGADAIAGVVNIILKSNFQGIEGYGEAGTSQHGGGTMYHGSATFGIGDMGTDHYNFFVNVEYEHDDALKVADRPFPFNTNNLSSIGGLNLIGGQPGNDSGSIYGSVAPAMVSVPPALGGANYVTSGVVNTGAVTQVLRPGGCGSLGTTSTDSAGNVYCAQNFESYLYDAPTTTREGVYARGSVQPNNDMQLYVDMSYFQYQYYNTLAPAQVQNPVPSNTDAIVLPARLTSPAGPGTGALNPNDPFANSPTCVEGVSCTDAAVNYAFGDIPSYETTISHALRSTIGVNGDWDGWTYSGALTIAHSWLNYTEAGFINYAQLIADVNDGAYNFLNPSANTAAVRAALAPNLTSLSTNDEDSLDVSAYRNVFDLPGGPASLGIGAQYRAEDNNNPSLNPGNEAQGLGQTYNFGSRNIQSVFAELDLPAFPHFDADLSARFDHYSDFGNTFNPKAGLKYTPFPWITLRGTASSGFRAPGFAEAGNGQFAGFTFQAVNDFSPAVAAAHGNDTYVTNDYAVEAAATSFAGIKPETSANYTGGFIVNPMENIAINMDYYYIEKWNLIQPANDAVAEADYYAGTPVPAPFVVVPDAADPLFPAALPRVALISSPYSNNGRLVTSGIDLGINASWDLWDDLHYTLTFDGTRLLDFVDEIPGNPRLEYVGTLSPCNVVDCEGTARDKFTLGNDFKFGPWDALVTTYYTSGMKNIESDLAGPGGSIYPTVPGSDGETWDVDLHVSYQLNDNVQIFGNIKDLLDTLPPLEPAQYGGVNYNPSSAQELIMGRFFQAGIRLKM